MKNLKDKLVNESTNTWALIDEDEKVIFAALDYVLSKCKDKEFIETLKKFDVQDFRFEDLYQDFADQLNKYESKLSGRISNAVSKI